MHVAERSNGGVGRKKNDEIISDASPAVAFGVARSAVSTGPATDLEGTFERPEKGQHTVQRDDPTKVNKLQVCECIWDRCADFTLHVQGVPYLFMGLIGSDPLQ